MFQPKVPQIRLTFLLVSNFETELESEIEKSTLINSWGWDWLNLPFTLWIFSAVGIGVLSFGYQGYSSCVLERRSDNLQLTRLVNEIYGRRERIAHLDAISADDLQSVIATLDGDRTYIFRDLKGKKMAELTIELDDLLQRWRLLPDPDAVLAEDARSVFDLKNKHWLGVYDRFHSTSSAVTPNLSFDAEAATKDEAKLNGALIAIKEAARKVKNDTEIGILVSQITLMRINCYSRVLEVSGGQGGPK